MKHIAWLFAMLLSVSVAACDICNFYSGINPGDFKNTFGFYYRSRLLSGTQLQTLSADGHRHGNTIAGTTTGTTTVYQQKESFSAYELRMRFYLNSKNQLQAYLPVIHNRLYKNENKIVDVRGMSDPSLIWMHCWADLNKGQGASYTAHRLWAGIGIKMPFGLKNMSYQGHLAENDFQASSESWDVLFVTQYSALYNQFGYNFIGSYKVNSEGKNHYRFGNSLNSSLSFFRKFQLNSRIRLSPTSGLFYETAASDLVNGSKLTSKGIQVLLASNGFQLSDKKFSFELNYQWALHNSGSTNVLPVKRRWIVGMTYNL